MSKFSHAARRRRHRRRQGFDNTAMFSSETAKLKMLKHRISWKVLKVSMRTGVLSSIIRVYEYKRSKSLFDF